MSWAAPKFERLPRLEKTNPSVCIFFHEYCKSNSRKVAGNQYQERIGIKYLPMAGRTSLFQVGD
jgi:hypothetical protein